MMVKDLKIVVLSVCDNRSVNVSMQKWNGPGRRATVKLYCSVEFLIHSLVYFISVASKFEGSVFADVMEVVSDELRDICCESFPVNDVSLRASS